MAAILAIKRFTSSDLQTNIYFCILHNVYLALMLSIFIEVTRALLDWRAVHQLSHLLKTPGKSSQQEIEFLRFRKSISNSFE